MFSWLANAWRVPELRRRVIFTALVLSAYVNPGARGKRFYSHYSLLHTCERLLGFHRFIGHAGDATTAGIPAATVRRSHATQPAASPCAARMHATAYAV